MRKLLEIIEVVVCLLGVGFCTCSAIYIACLFASFVFNMIF